MSDPSPILCEECNKSLPHHKHATCKKTPICLIYASSRDCEDLNMMPCVACNPNTANEFNLKE